MVRMEITALTAYDVESSCQRPQCNMVSGRTGSARDALRSYVQIKARVAGTLELVGALELVVESPPEVCGPVWMDSRKDNQAYLLHTSDFLHWWRIDWPSAVMLMAFFGRISGISGIVDGLISGSALRAGGWRLAF